MIEELRIIAEMMGGLTNGAIIVASIYMTCNFFKVPFIIFITFKGITLVMSKLKVEKR